MRDSGPRLLERVLGAATGLFLAAVLLVAAVHLLEAVLPALVLLALAGLLITGAGWWIRHRRGGW